MKTVTLAGMLMLVSRFAAGSSTVFSNFGPGYEYDLNQSITLATATDSSLPWVVFVPFVAASDAVLRGVLLPIPVNEVRINTCKTAFLTCSIGFSVHGIGFPDYPLYSYAMQENRYGLDNGGEAPSMQMTAGQTYYLVIASPPPNDGLVPLNVTGDRQNLIFWSNHNFTEVNDQITPAFAINDTLNDALLLPEPGHLTLPALALLEVHRRARRRSARDTHQRTK